MSLERRDVTFYDSEANAQFSSALVESLVVPAYFTSLHHDALAGALDNTTSADCEVRRNGNRIEYDFFAEVSEKTICISSTYYSKLDNLTHDGARLISEEIQSSSVPDDLKKRYRDSDILRVTGNVETFTRRNFHIELRSNACNVDVLTDLGYSVDGLEISSPAPLKLRRDTLFGTDEIEEIVRALLSMGLVEDSDVKHFLNQF